MALWEKIAIAIFGLIWIFKSIIGRWMLIAQQRRRQRNVSSVGGK